MGFSCADVFCGRWKRASDGAEAEPILPAAGRSSLLYSAVAKSSVFQLESGPGLSGEYKDFSHSYRALKLMVLYILSYLALGIVAYSFVFEKWPIVDSLYFAIVTFTTIGYGDMSPTTQAGQLFTIFFALYGISILGIFLGIIGETVVVAQEEALERAKSATNRRVIKMFHKDEKNEEDLLVEKAILEKEHSIWRDLKELAVKEAPIVIALAVIAIVIGRFEGWSIITSLYYCVITSTTVGFGDLVPDNEVMKLVAIFFLPLSVAVFGEILGRIAGFYMERKTDAAEKEFLNRQLTLSDLAIMDSDGDGGVDMGEFLSFMLVAMQKVDEEDIEELKTLFRSLDADNSGSLQKEDLVILAKRKEGVLA